MKWLRCFFLLLLVPACAARPLAVWVTVPPQKYFVERVGGDHVSVEVLVAPGRSPETYAPTARQMARLAGADLFFSIGMPVEEVLLEKIASTMGRLEFVATAEGHAHDHDHADGADTCDPHSWMDPGRVVGQVEVIRDALADIDPERADFYAARADGFISELEAVDAQFSDLFKRHAGRSFFINHPSLGAFAEAYGLRQRAVEIEGRAASAKRLGSLIDEVREAGVSRLYAQPQFGRSGIDVIAGAFEMPVVTVDPLAEDYLVNLRSVARALLEGFEPVQ